MANPAPMTGNPPRGFRTRVTVALSVGVVVLLGGVVLGAFLVERGHVREEVAERLAEVDRIRSAHLQEDYALMDTALSAITNDRRFTRALAEGNRDTLLELAQPLFVRLHHSAQITHFYFTGPDRRNILRVHKPDQSGDVIDRFTTREAERTGRPAHGVELGPLGTLSMRVVHPVFDGETRIGYMELGHEMEHMVDFLRETRDMEVVALVAKEHLVRAGWEEGMRMLEREASWDRFPDCVATNAVPAGVRPPVLDRLVAGGLRELPEEGTTIPIASRFRLGALPLTDAAGRDVGKLVLILDMTDRAAASVRFVLGVALACMTAGALLVGGLYLQMTRIERRYHGASG